MPLVPVEITNRYQMGFLCYRVIFPSGTKGIFFRKKVFVIVYVIFFKVFATVYVIYFALMLNEVCFNGLFPIFNNLDGEKHEITRTCYRFYAMVSPVISERRGMGRTKYFCFFYQCKNRHKIVLISLTKV